MSTIYRAVCKSNAVKERYMIAPHTKLEKPRDSKSLQQQAAASLLDLLSTGYSGGRAYLERNDRYGTTVEVEYVPTPIESDQYSGRVTKTRWDLVKNNLGVKLPTSIIK